MENKPNLYVKLVGESRLYRYIKGSDIYLSFYSNIDKYLNDGYILDDIGIQDIYCENKSGKYYIFYGLNREVIDRPYPIFKDKPKLINIVEVDKRPNAKNRPR